jgi:hypothetical protein
MVADAVGGMSATEFLDMEARMTHLYPFEETEYTLFSLTGSNPITEGSPLRENLMQRITAIMPVVWIDVSDDVIVERLRKKC